MSRRTLLLTTVVTAMAATSAFCTSIFNRTVFLQYWLLSGHSFVLCALRTLPGIVCAGLSLELWRWSGQGDRRRTAAAALGVLVSIAAVSLTAGVLSYVAAALAGWTRVFGTVIRYCLTTTTIPFVIMSALLLPLTPRLPETRALDSFCRCVTICALGIVLWICALAVEPRISFGNPPGGGYMIGIAQSPRWDAGEAGYVRTVTWGEHWSTRKITLSQGGATDCIVEEFDPNRIQVLVRDPRTPSEWLEATPQNPPLCQGAIALARSRQDQ